MKNDLLKALSIAAPLALATACAPAEDDSGAGLEFRHGHGHGHGGHGGGCDDDDDDDDDDDAQEIEADAGFSCDFGIAQGTPPELIPPTIERDRMYMADQPGMIYGKHLPLTIDLQNGDLFSGGRYLFGTKQEAAAYKQWVTQDYALDGVQFLARPEVISPECHQWQNIAAFELGDISLDHVVMRTERWSIPGNKNPKHYIEEQVDDILDGAEALGLTGVWVLYQKDERLVEIVYIGGRVAPPNPGELDFNSFFALAGAPTLGAAFDAKGWTRVLDRTHFVLSIWFPFVLGDQGAPSLWPNSPPLPAPFCTDGVCSVSRGENNDTCPADCTPNCGDAVCDPDEGPANCPGDCRIRPPF
ncbi:MAG: hypothetical protein U0168_01750 [Nannocystaceae bacterium]